MTKGITGKEPNPREVYGDIIDLPHHESDHHPPMSLDDRAAQFSPYSALSGYGDLISEEARLVDCRTEPGEEDTEQLNHRLNRIRDMTAHGTQPAVAITYFVPDPLKDGGRYETITAKVRRVDAARQTVVLDRRAGISGARVEIRIGDILDIQGLPAEPAPEQAL